MKWILAVLLAVAAVAAADQYNPNGTLIYDLNKAYDYFQQFIRDYGRHYKDTAEFFYRFQIFKQRLKEINARNAISGPGGATFGINDFTDRTHDEARLGPVPTPPVLYG